MATVTHNIPRGLFHVSEANHNGKVFRPRIPHSAEESENMDIKRICFSTSITGAIRAIGPIYRTCGIYFVHIPDIDMKELYNSDKVLTPTVEDVFDVKTTREKWVVCDVKMKCVGAIRAKITRRHRIEWRWLKM